MGFSTVVAFSILLISFLAASAVVYSVIAENYEEVKEVMEKRNERELEKLNTKINITSITVTGNATLYSLQVVVRNEGSTTLDVSKFSILVDGNLTDFAYSPSGLLYPADTTTIFLNNLSGGGLHRLKVVTENGVGVYGSYGV